MITGFNTDIPFDGITYHVQTEDKGLDTPLILSLVYVGGAIIASKRTPYEDLLGSNFDEKVLTERLQRQHKLICAAIKAGRVEDLKRMAGAAGEDAAKQEGAPAGENGKAAASRRRKTSAQLRVEARAPAEQKGAPAEQKDEGTTAAAAPAPKAAPEVKAAEVEADAEEKKTAAEVKSAAVEDKDAAVEDNVPAGGGKSAGGAQPVEEKPAEKKPAERKAPVGIVEERVRPRPAAAEDERPRASGSVVPLEFGLDILTNLVDEISALGEEQQSRATSTQEPAAAEEPPVEVVPDSVIIVEPEVVAVEPMPLSPWGVQAAVEEYPAEELYLSLLDDEGDFRAGQLATIKVHVGRGAYGRVPVAGASVTVKVLGTTFRPLILTTDTDERGLAIVRALLPRFNSGRAAIIIRATAGEEFSELRRIIHQ